MGKYLSLAVLLFLACKGKKDGALVERMQRNASLYLSGVIAKTSPSARLDSLALSDVAPVTEKDLNRLRAENCEALAMQLFEKAKNQAGQAKLLRQKAELSADAFGAGSKLGEIAVEEARSANSSARQTLDLSEQMKKKAETVAAQSADSVKIVGRAAMASIWVFEKGKMERVDGLKFAFDLSGRVLDLECK